MSDEKTKLCPKLRALKSPAEFKEQYENNWDRSARQILDTVFAKVEQRTNERMRRLVGGFDMESARFYGTPIERIPIERLTDYKLDALADLYGLSRTPGETDEQLQYRTRQAWLGIYQGTAPKLLVTDELAADEDEGYTIKRVHDEIQVFRTGETQPFIINGSRVATDEPAKNKNFNASGVQTGRATSSGKGQGSLPPPVGTSSVRKPYNASNVVVKAGGKVLTGTDSAGGISGQASPWRKFCDVPLGVRFMMENKFGTFVKVSYNTYVEYDTFGSYKGQVVHRMEFTNDVVRLVP